MEERNQELRTASLIKTVLSNEVKFVVGILIFCLGPVRSYYKMEESMALMQKDISIINSNHEMHIQDLTQEIKDIKQAEIIQNQQIIEMQKQVLIILNNQSKK